MVQRRIDQIPFSDPPPRMTYEEFLEWIPDGKQAEWVDSAVTILTVNERRDAFSILLVSLLSAYVHVFNLGRVLHAPFQMRLRFRPSGREPDILFLRNDHLDRIDRLWIEGPVDLIIEFLSEQTARIDQFVKLREYEQAGVLEYVMIETRDGRNGIWLYRLGDDGRYTLIDPDADGRIHSTVIPGFWFDPAWFTEDPRPLPEDLMFEIAPETYMMWLQTWQSRRHR